ncbi:hypothetical protein TWF594_004490 [Orbilia oligospora]|uniref:TauD/TfdA-like domain-containing protein n=1 Tax=Orbilia oligospora TaxID=2813651 RepID=A0A7C8NNV6_ORBOL|nr:hypothetical protein TWF703_001114 [Orbilia oligospora]KAF3144900.1 hypothetical protein TWF594_004490 [Orbilia oligospora]
MASTLRSVIRCTNGSRASFTTSTRVSSASRRCLSSRALSQPCRTPNPNPRNAIKLQPSNFNFPTRQLSTVASDPKAVALEIPVFQFKDILPHGELPPTKTLKVNIDGQPFVFDNVFLRDACTCNTCVDPSTQQKLFTTSDIPTDIYPRRARVSDGRLKIEWSHRLTKSAIPENLKSDYHWSFYSGEFLKNSATPIASVKSNMSDFRRIYWDKKIMEKEVFWIEYEDYMKNEVALAKALRHLSFYGLIFIRNVPDGREVDQVPGLAERIGNLKRTFYGDTWTVKSIPKSKNIAYTSLDLGLHMDLLYFESPPGLQFLHCVENTVTGGESYFADAMRAAFMIQATSPTVFDTLTRFPVNFHYHNDAKHYRFSRPIVVMKNPSENYHPQLGIDHINWAPPFQAPFTMDNTGAMVSKSTHWRKFLKGMGQLNDQFENPANQYEYLLKEGDCVVFFNRRVLHARKGFDAQSGKRRLTGGYVDIDAFESACRVLAERHPEEGRQDTTGFEYLTEHAKDFGYTQWS